MYHVGDVVRLVRLKPSEHYISSYLTVGQCYVIEDLNRTVIGLRSHKDGTWYVSSTDIENIRDDNPTGWDMP
jgi:hypothetical protein